MQCSSEVFAKQTRIQIQSYDYACCIIESQLQFNYKKEYYKYKTLDSN